MEPIFIIDPPVPPPRIRSLSIRPASQNSWHIRNVPFKLTSSTLSQSSFERLASLASRVIPAQLTRIEAAEEVDETALIAISSAPAIAPLICDLFVTSQRYGWIKMSLLVASWHAAATASNLSFWPPVSARRRLHLHNLSRKLNDKFGEQLHLWGEFGNQDNTQKIALSSEVAYPCSANAMAVAGEVIVSTTGEIRHSA
jgi:hypothetical protein